MERGLEKMLVGYKTFKQKFATEDGSLMEHLSVEGQSPEIMMITCSDSRVDPAVVMQCQPGDLFVVRNVANILPPAENHNRGVSSALEYGVCYLNVKELIIMGHTQCGGLAGRLDGSQLAEQDEFISDWVSILDNPDADTDPDEFAKKALLQSYANAQTFSWLKERLEQETLTIHLWLFNIKDGTINAYDFEQKQYNTL